MTDRRLKHAPMRARLHPFAGRSKDPEASARSPRAEDNQNALEKLRAIRTSASPNTVLGTDWDQGNARHWVVTPKLTGKLSRIEKDSFRAQVRFAHLSYKSHVASTEDLWKNASLRDQ